MGKKVERGKVSHQLERECNQKCAFLNRASPYLHHQIWSFCWLCLPLALAFSIHFHFWSHLPCFFAIYFRFSLLSCKWVLPIAHSLWHSLWHLHLLLQLDCSGNLIHSLDFSLTCSINKWVFPFYLLCHMYFTFTLTMPHGIVDIPTWFVHTKVASSCFKENLVPTPLLFIIDSAYYAAYGWP